MSFKIETKFKPAGDQPNAIKELVKGLNEGKADQVLLGATGTGKTFTVANVIQATNKATIVLSHNKTLAAQLYTELKQLFPNNAVEYYISYFDYYRPEAYMPSSDTFIDKTSKGNWDIEAMRLSTINALSTRKDVIVVASVASIYGTTSPESYKSMFYPIEIGMNIGRRKFFNELVQRSYTRNNIDLLPGTFQAKGDVVKIAPVWSDEYYIRLDFFGDELEKINRVDTITGEVLATEDSLTIFPAYAYATGKDAVKGAIKTIASELKERLAYFKKEGKLLEAQRIEQRTNQDLESLDEFGTVAGMENYSRHVDGRSAGEKPWTIMDYFPKDSLMVIDESHMMIPQLNAMYNGDRARKLNLVDYGFRLPSALDNRPLRFDEFEDNYDFQKIYVSATPAEYETDKTGGEIVSQIIRPTGLLDPIISVVKTEGQVEHMYDLLQDQKKRNERTFILTTTKRMAEELSRYFQERGEKVAYMHSEHKTFEREEILRKLRKGVYIAVIGINLLREGIDIPEVSLVLVLDADKESFFRSTRALTQISGRAARNLNGRVIFYGDSISRSMKETMDLTNERRKIQAEFNEKHGITPKSIVKPIPAPINAETKDGAIEAFLNEGKKDKAAKKAFIKDLRTQMAKASRELDFERAAQLRDVIIELEAN